MFADKAEILVKELEDIFKRSRTLAVKKLSNLNILGARPKDTYVYRPQTKQNARLDQPSNAAPGRQTHRTTKQSDKATKITQPQTPKVVPAIINNCTEFEDS